MSADNLKRPTRRARGAYNEYAADMLANRLFRALTLSERGILYAMRLEAAAHGPLPADLDQLATRLGVARHELAGALPQLMPFFALDGDCLAWAGESLGIRS